MTPAERAALIAYVREQRRHLLAQVKACDLLLSVIECKPETLYNENVNARETVTISGVRISG